MRAVVFTGAGGPEVVSLEEREDPLPGGREILVSVTHAGLNPADLNQRAGRHPAPPGSPPDVPGLEVAGTVIGRGPAARRWSEGDAVFGIVGGGGLADRVLVDEDHVTEIPPNLDAVSAAAAPEAFVTAHDAIFSQAGLRLGETLLVNGANGGVGSAGVQLAKAAGAAVIAGIRSEGRREALAELGAEVAVGPDELGAAVKRAGGVDVVLELVGAPNLDADIDALALLGRIVIVGTGAGTEAQLALRKLMAKRARIFGTGLRNRTAAEKAAAVTGFAHAVVPLLRDGRAAPPIDRVFPVRDVVAAFDHLERPGKFGKVLIEFGPGG